MTAMLSNLGAIIGWLLAARTSSADAKSAGGSTDWILAFAGGPQHCQNPLASRTNTHTHTLSLSLSLSLSTIISLPSPSLLTTSRWFLVYEQRANYSRAFADHTLKF
jgi:hypothetical protein